MARFIPVVRFSQYFLFIIIILFLFVLSLIILNQNCLHSCTNQHFVPSNITRYQRFCDRINQRILTERIPAVPIQLDPQRPIPYFYSQWRSTPLLPRVITPCEHAIYMELLSILIEHVFNKYNIKYMMMAATLLGSYTRHDLLPWDDDIDLRVAISDRYYLQSIILGELSDEPYSLILMEMHNPRNYDKVFFSWCPHTSAERWRFPFIDIFYHDENSTHLWLLSNPSSCPVRREDIFPLVLRPLGSLWLYGPSEPMAHFESRYMVDIETGCFAHPYSHKYERTMATNIVEADCSKLKSFYPYVQRQCTSQCTEELKLGNDIIMHSITYNYTYRTFSYSEKNASYKAC